MMFPEMLEFSFVVDLGFFYNSVGFYYHFNGFFPSHHISSASTLPDIWNSSALIRSTGCPGTASRKDTYI